ncbi:MAG: intradiol ring-cleavage dioxygenase [Caldilinea sp. CFX5]|nr:intradiol ring-cleavage dioxygenase [Caldilinea sp. CFX5]
MQKPTSTLPHLAEQPDNDDLPIGRILSRREVLTLLGVTGATTLLSACVPINSNSGASGGNTSPAGSGNNAGATTTDQSAMCVVRPELTEGPLFVDEDLNRRDLRSDPATGKISEGAQFNLTIRVNQIAQAACTPLAGVRVDLWHCDAAGVYSDTDQLGFQTVGQKFLRGYQMTDANGIAQFTTIYPGWYQGRTVHIHIKVRTDAGYDFTSQLFFDDNFTDAVFAAAPYNRRGERRLRNEDDGIFRQSGEQMMLAVNQVDPGYAATFDIALDLS